MITGGVWLLITYSIFFIFTLYNNNNSKILISLLFWLPDRNEETARYQTIFRLATAYELLIFEFV